MSGMIVLPGHSKQSPAVRALNGSPFTANNPAISQFFSTVADEAGSVYRRYLRPEASV